MGGELLSLPRAQDVLLAKAGRGLSPTVGKQPTTVSQTTDIQASSQHRVLQPKGLLWGDTTIRQGHIEQVVTAGIEAMGPEGESREEEGKGASPKSACQAGEVTGGQLDHEPRTQGQDQGQEPEQPVDLVLLRQQRNRSRAGAGEEEQEDRVCDSKTGQKQPEDPVTTPPSGLKNGPGCR